MTSVSLAVVAKNRTVVGDIDLPILEQVPTETTVETALPEIETDTEATLPVVED